jgi:hypothetical protein
VSCGNCGLKNFVPPTLTIYTKTREGTNGNFAKRTHGEKTIMNRWIVNGLEVRHIPKLGWAVLKEGEVKSVHANVADALSEVKEEDER